MKICSFCHVAFVSIAFCFLVQNFVDIGQSVNELLLWPKSDFPDGGRRHLEISKISISYVTVIGSIADVAYQISSKSDNF